MLVKRSEEKLINSVIYFVQNTKYCGKTKLFKLLYFLDFEHFSITGRSVTGLQYSAWPKGPVPADIFDEVDSPKGPLKDSVEVSKKQAYNGNLMYEIVPTKRFSADHFTKRELRILKELCDKYENSYADDMIEATHLENLPWHEVYEVQGKKQQEIPYELALRKSEYDQVIKNVHEDDEIQGNYG